MTIKTALRLSLFLGPVVFLLACWLLSVSAQADITLALSATSRQIVVSYTAPDNNPCTIEVSESNTYSPVVNDVNTTLFSGSNSDSRAGSIGVGTSSRVMVIGTFQQPYGVTPLVAGNFSTYSRTLQVNTTHYLRITCGSHTGTGSISTKNRPLGMTRGEEPPLTSAGTYGWPTVNGASRAEQFIDPVYGTVVRKVTIVADEDTGGADALLFGSGAAWPWSQTTVNDSGGNPGYLIMLPSQNGVTRLYWFNTATGVSRRLGMVILRSGQLTGIGTSFVSANAGAMFSTADATKLYFLVGDNSGEARVVRCQLPASGNSYYDADVTSTADASCGGNWTDLTPTTTLTDKMVAFDAAYDPSKFSNTLGWIQGDYILMIIRRGVQDSYGWLAAYQISTNSIVGMNQLWTKGNATGSGTGGGGFRWCGIHSAHQALGTNKMSFTPKVMYQTGVGLGPYTVTLSVGISNSATQVTLSSNTPTAPFADTTLYNLAAGDEIQIDGEVMFLSSFVSGTTWNVTNRGASGSVAVSHSIGAVVQANCRCHNPNDVGQVGPTWWDFLNDPHGNDTTGANLVTQLGNVATYSGHEGFAKPNGTSGYGIAETGWRAFIGESGVDNTAFGISDSAEFNGKAKSGAGNAWQKHAAPPQQTVAGATQGTDWGVDAFELEGDVELGKTTLTNITGSLFKFVNTNYTIAQKKRGLLAFIGVHPLLDVSSPATGDVIGGLVGDSYKICLAYKANECRTGAAAGDIYVNGPSLTAGSNCLAGSISNTDATELCVGHSAAFGQSILQIRVVNANNTGKWLRSLTSGLRGYKSWNPNSDPHTSPDGKWVLFPYYGTDNHLHVWAVKAPPIPNYDSIDRNDYIQKSVTVAPVAGASEAFVRFGYDPSFNCTSRAENCVAATSNSPYFLESSDSYTAVSCTVGCSVNVPIIPDRTAYYQVVYRNSLHAVVSTSGTFVVTEGSAAVGGGPAPVPTPTPTPTPTPVPTPTPTPTATPTPSPTPSPSPSASPTPSPTPEPTPTPSPTPSGLPVCRPNQVVGSPATCRCTTKLIGPANARRCRA